MRDQPSWMPGDDPPLARLIFDRDKFRDGEPYPLRIHEETRLRRLIERTALKAQIEEQENWNRCSGEEYHAAGLCIKCGRIKKLRARLVELEKLGA